MNWMDLGKRVLLGRAVSRDETLAALAAPDDDALALLAAAFEVRKAHFGRRVNLHVLRNARSGMCPEDCSFCSQSSVSSAPIQRYSMQSADELVEGARRACELGAVKYCMVTSSRSPDDGDFSVLCEALRRIKKEMRIHLCVSIGMLTDRQAKALKTAGADRINHNLETSRRYFPEICRTHTYDDRLATIRAAKAAGLEICCGGLIGMGETLEDRVDLALELRDLKVHSIPVNFFDPRPGTALANVPRIAPTECLKALAMFRLVNPACDIRAAGGRETNLRHLQPLALFAANSIFTEGYLTTGGQGYKSDLAMIEDAGFQVGVIEA